MVPRRQDPDRTKQRTHGQAFPLLGGARARARRPAARRRGAACAAWSGWASLRSTPRRGSCGSGSPRRPVGEGVRPAAGARRRAGARRAEARAAARGLRVPLAGSDAHGRRARVPAPAQALRLATLRRQRARRRLPHRAAVTLVAGPGRDGWACALVLACDRRPGAAPIGSGYDDLSPLTRESRWRTARRAPDHHEAGREHNYPARIEFAKDDHWAAEAVVPVGPRCDGCGRLRRRARR
jgi:hypothetical protein